MASAMAGAASRRARAEEWAIRQAHATARFQRIERLREVERYLPRKAGEAALSAGRLRSLEAAGFGRVTVRKRDR